MKIILPFLIALGVYAQTCGTLVQNPQTHKLDCIGAGGPTGPAGGSSAYTTVSFSATPTFTVTAGTTAQEFFITLTANVTSSTLTTTNATTGQLIIFNICQNGTGLWTFVYPTNVTGAASISGTASVCSRQVFVYDGTNAIASTVMYSPGATGGSISLAGATSGTSVLAASIINGGTNTLPPGTNVLIGDPTTDPNNGGYPGTAAITWVDFNTPASVVASAKGLFLTGTADANKQIRGQLHAIPHSGTNYTITVKVKMIVPAADFGNCGIFISDGTNISTSKLITMDLYNDNTIKGLILGVTKWDKANNGTSVDYATPNLALNIPNGIDVWLQVVDDGTNLLWKISLDGYNFILRTSQLRTDYLTATHTGYFCNAYSSSKASYMLLNSWVEQ